MKKIMPILQNYLIFSFPFVLAIAIWGDFQPFTEIENNSSLLIRLLWEVGSWNLITWFVLLIVFLICLVVYPQVQEQTLKRIANLKERDEREEYLTGRASRSSYLSMMSVLIFLLFISILQVKVKHVPENEVINGKHKIVSIGLGLKLIDETQPKQDSAGQVLFQPEKRRRPLLCGCIPPVREPPMELR
jgi:hypothetical protein